MWIRNWLAGDRLGGREHALEWGWGQSIGTTSGERAVGGQAGAPCAMRSQARGHPSRYHAIRQR